MISIDDHPPPDPSSSHHRRQRQQEISHDLKVSDTDLKLPDADPDDTNNPTPNFSIRDYVYSSRSKDVACNWPFSHRSLQLCLKHGVKNLLPPFQSLDLLKDNSCLSKCSLEKRFPDELISSFDEKSTENQLESNIARVSGFVSSNLSGSKRDNDSQFHLLEHLAHTRSMEKPPAYQKTENVKKVRLVLKLNSGIEPVGEVAPNSFIVSETMASKVCPVCKIFTSSSNTTLNAHIDQCLTGEGTMKWTENSKVIVKHRIKPRKTRLMVDIYQTARYCTVEELDRRNGTSWATNSSFPAQEFKYQGEEEKEDKEEPRMNATNPVIADTEGDVYIDTNGTKVRILSVPKAGSSDDHKARKLLEGVKRSKIAMGKKKNSIFKQKHHPKYLKLSPNAGYLFLPKPQARNGQEDDVVVAENCSRDPVNTKVADLAIVRPPWACSKRTDLAKKFRGKHTKDLLIESRRSSSQSKFGTPRSLFNDVVSLKSRKKLRTSSLVLTSNVKSEFRKERSHMHDDCEGSPDSSPSHHSNGADFISKGGTFSYLKKDFSFSDPKKRKLSSVKKSRELCLLNEKYVDEPSQDSSEEHMESWRKEETRSVTSKSSDEESMDALPDIESIRNGKSLNIEQVCVNPGSFVGLSNSFDPEFSKQEGTGLYQDPATNYSPNGGDDTQKQESYFQEVDPIPIPGPPGSFLPSPGGETVSDEPLYTNSSLITTTILPSSEIHHHQDLIDQDSMSTSPVSDVSNPSLARSDSRCSEKLAHKSNPVEFLVTNGDTRFKNDQPCCCCRKEASSGFRNFDQVASNHQDSSMLRKHEMFSRSNYPTSPPSEKPAIFPTVKVLPPYGYRDSAASPSKPVLRLMGKNLTVVKTDEDASSSSPQFRPLETPQQPVIFTHYQNGPESQNANLHPQINMMRNHVDLRSSNGSYIAMVERYGHSGPLLGPTRPEPRSHHGFNGASGSMPVKEIVVIDDSSENEGDDSMRKEFVGRNWVQKNPVYTTYQHPYGGGLPVFRGGFHMPLSNVDLGKWEVVSSSPLSSMTHLRSSTPYNPPGYP